MNIAGQGAFGLGMFQAIQQIAFNSKFARNIHIAMPDVALALIVGAVTYFSMIMMPSSADQANILLFVMPLVICVL